MSAYAGEITAAHALNHRNHLAQILLEFCRVQDGVLPDPVGCHFRSRSLPSTPFLGNEHQRKAGAKMRPINIVVSVEAATCCLRRGLAQPGPSWQCFPSHFVAFL